MNKIIFSIGIGLVSGFVGFCIGSKWTEKKLDEKYNDIYSKEFELIKKSYKERHENEEKEESKPLTEDDPAVQMVKQTQEAVKAAILKENEKRRKRQLEDDDYEDDDHLIITEEKRPVIISYDEYYQSSRREYSFTYDTNTAVLINDDNDEPIEPDLIDDLVGFEALDLLENGGEDIVYVYSPGMDADYVIQKAD